MTLTEYLEENNISLNKILILFKGNVYNPVGDSYSFKFNDTKYQILGGSRPLVECSICIFIDTDGDLLDLNKDTVFFIVKDRYTLKIQSNFHKPFKTKFDKLFNSKFSILDQFEITTENIVKNAPTTTFKEFKNLSDFEKMINSIPPNFKIIDIEDNSDLYDNYHGDF